MDVAVEALEKLAGRHVPAESEYFVWFGPKPGHIDDWYYSLALTHDEDVAAELIRDLPVALILSGRDMEHGLVPLYEAGAPSGSQEWKLAEAFCRLGVLPPATELNLSRVEGLDMSEETQQYVVAAMLRAWELHREFIDKQVEDLKALQSA
jgi:hypothetical protein